MKVKKKIEWANHSIGDALIRKFGEIGKAFKFAESISKSKKTVKV